MHHFHFTKFLELQQDLNVLFLSFNWPDDTAMLWGVKRHNDNLLQAGLLGNVQSDILFRKDSSTFTFDNGWAFPRRIYFNGDSCVMPPLDAYPYLPHTSSPETSSRNTIAPTASSPDTIAPTTSSPNTSSRQQILVLTLMITLVSSLAFCFAYVWGSHGRCNHISLCSWSAYCLNSTQAILKSFWMISVTL